MNDRAPFSRASGYYDLFYSRKPYAREARFVLSELTRAGGSTGRVLDLGCGTGRHAVAFASGNRRVLGVDRSAGLLRAARARRAALPAKRRRLVRFQLADARTFRAARRFDAVVSLFHAIGYAASDRDMVRVFRVARRHLEVGGLFLFDAWHGPAAERRPGRSLERRVKNADAVVTRRSSSRLDLARRVVMIRQDYEIRRSRRSPVVFTEEHAMRYFFAADVARLAARSRFQVVKAAGWLTGRRPGRFTRDVYFICRAVA